MWVDVSACRPICADSSSESMAARSAVKPLCHLSRLVDKVGVSLKNNLVGWRAVRANFAGGLLAGS